MLCVDRHRVIYLVFMFIEVTKTNVVLEKEIVLEKCIKNIERYKNTENKRICLRNLFNFLFLFMTFGFLLM